MKIYELEGNTWRTYLFVCFMYVCICVYVFVCVLCSLYVIEHVYLRCAHLDVHMSRLEVDVIYLLVFDRVSHFTWSSSFQLDFLTRKPSGATCLCPPRAEHIGMCHHVQIFPGCLEWDLGPHVCVTLHPLSHIPSNIPRANFLINGR